MVHSNSKFQRAVKALRDLRPDFTEHNARVLVEEVTNAPEGAFSAKPLRWHLEERTSTRDAPSAAWPHAGKAPQSVRMYLGDGRIGESHADGTVIELAGPDISVPRVPSDPTAASLHVGTDVGEVFDQDTLRPVDVTAARSGDLIVLADGTAAVCTGAGDASPLQGRTAQALVAAHAKNDLERHAEAYRTFLATLSGTH